MLLLAFSLSLSLSCVLPGLQFDEFLLVLGKKKKKANVISLRLQQKTPKRGLLTVTSLT